MSDSGIHNPILLRYSPIILGFIVFIFLILSVSQWVSAPFPNFSLNENREVFFTFIITTIGVLILFGLFFFLKKITVTEKSVDLAQQNLVTEKLTWAIKQLRILKPEVQLAGIFTLESIAKEFEKYHWEIMEVLTAFVRENARYSGNKANQNSQKSNQVAANIQTILTVIGRRRWTQQEIEQNNTIDLERTALQGLNLRGVNFAGVNLVGANLEGAQLVGANLEGATLAEANLKNANLSRVNLTRANLGGAKLEGANLRNANMHYSNLESANLKGVKVQGADFLNANFKGAFLANTNLEGANTQGVDLDSAFFMELY